MFTCCCFSHWPPSITWQRDRDMLHKVLPPVSQFLSYRSCFSRWPPGRFTCQRDCDMLQKICRDPTLGRVVCTPRREWSCKVLRRLIHVCLARGLVLVCAPAYPYPSSPARPRLDLSPTPAPLHRESPLALNSLDGRGLLRNCAMPWDASTPLCL